MLADPKLELVLRYLKLRWLRDIADQITGSDGAEILAFEDLDLDRDMIELARVTGTQLLTRFASFVLASPGDLDLSGRALASLSPELKPSEAQIFLRIVACNLAFRLRTDELLTSLCSYTASGPGPRLAPAVLGALLARARSERDGRALLEASPLTGDALEAAQATATPEPMTLDGAWLHVDLDDEALDKVVPRALLPTQPLPWTRAITVPGATKLLALRRRGGWRTLLGETDRLDLDLGKALIKAKAPRVVWASFGAAGLGLQVLEGTRTVLDLESLEAKIGAPPSADDVAGVLRGLGILDLDPDHPRGVSELTFAANVEKCLSKRNSRAWAFAE